MKASTLKTAARFILLLIFCFSPLAFAASPPAPPQAPSQKPPKKPEHPIRWVPSFEIALKMAAQQDKPVMVVFHADWASASQYLKNHILTNQKIIDESRQFINVKVNTDKQKKLTNHYKVYGLPTILFMNGDGKVLYRLEGAPREASYFLTLMKKVYRQFQQNS